MIINNLHKQPTALDTVVHRNLLLDNQASIASLLASFTSFSVTVSEFAEAGREFPILFVRSAPEGERETVAPVAVFGLKAGENLFLKDDRWLAGYMPAIMRAYPFTMARIEGADRWALVFDQSWSGIGREHGKPLFNEKGEATELLTQVHTFVQEIEADVERTRQACALLLEHKLLKGMRFDATLANGETISVDGFMTVDEDAIAKLTDAQIVTFYRNGLLNLLHTHQLSLGNMRRLLDRRFQREAEARSA